MKRFVFGFAFLAALHCGLLVVAQNASPKTTGTAQNDVTTVTATGTGSNREEARKDALRNAVEQAVGTSVASNSRMENYALLEDVVSTRSNGYIASFDVVSEGQKSDAYEMVIKANVTLSALRADFRTLAQAIGGVRFMVMYDPRTEVKEQLDEFDFAVERINEQLAARRLRYIESKRFKQLANEASNLLQESDTNELSFAQQLGLKSGAQFIWFIKAIRVRRSTADFARQRSKVIMELKAYDNCTAEGLGTVQLESDWAASNNADDATRAALADLAKNQLDKLMDPFTAYVGDWVQNGTPFELRFYSLGTFRDFRELRQKMKANPNFGGEMEIVGADNYQTLNCTFRKTPDELADIILDYADDVPGLKAKRVDVKLIYGRQINFAPSNYSVPELQGAADAGASSPATRPAIGPASRQPARAVRPPSTNPRPKPRKR